eukprot:355635-Chlamydomonas_euryale.AAC.3
MTARLSAASKLGRRGRCMTVVARMQWSQVEHQLCNVLRPLGHEKGSQIQGGHGVPWAIWPSQMGTLLSRTVWALTDVATDAARGSCSAGSDQGKAATAVARPAAIGGARADGDRGRAMRSDLACDVLSPKKGAARGLGCSGGQRAGGKAAAAMGLGFGCRAATPVPPPLLAALRLPFIWCASGAPRIFSSRRSMRAGLKAPGPFSFF